VLTDLPGVLTAAVYDSSGHVVPLAALQLRIVSSAPTSFAEMVTARAVSPSRPGSVPVTVGSAQGFLVDSAGRIQLAFKLGKFAQTVRVEMRTAVSGLASPDTLSFVVTAGRTVQINPSPRDTAAYVDGSYQIVARPTDAYGNATSDVVRFSGDSAAASTTASGAVTGRQIGRALFRLEAAPARDSVWTSVVPRGTLAAIRGSAANALVQFNLDGSGLTVLNAKAVSDPSWSHVGNKLAFVAHDVSVGEGQIIIRDMTSGTDKPLIPNASDYEVAPTFSGDDSSVLFAGRTVLSNILRVRLDGSATDTIAVPPPYPPNYGTDPTFDGAYTSYSSPSASAGGRYVAYNGLASCCVTWVVYVKDLQTGTRTKIASRELPKWLGSTDTLVAHVLDGFDLMRSDGSRVRGIPYPRITTLDGMRYDVSPDGRWIAVATYIGSNSKTSIELVNLTTGVRLPLAFTSGMTYPAWRP